MPSTATEPHAPHIPTLDGWRAVAILLVLLGHGSDEIARATAALGYAVHVPREAGLFGVQIFFALSGYLITTNLFEEESWRGRVSLASFYIRRVFRIIPAVLMFLAAVALLTAVGILDVAPSRWFATLFMLANYSSSPGSWYVGHFWSLAIEEHFYLVWPLSFVMLRLDVRRATFVIGAALTVGVWRAIAFKYHLTWDSPAVFWGRTDLQADGILWGVALAVLRRLPRARSRLDLLAARPLAPLVIAAVLVAVEMLSERGWKAGMAAISMRSALLPMLILATVLRPRGALGRLLETSGLRWIGKVSYSLYLWQQLFLVWDSSRAPALEWLQSFPLGIVAALLAAWLSYTLVERPCIAWGRRLRAAVTRRAAVPATP